MKRSEEERLVLSRSMFSRNNAGCLSGHVLHQNTLSETITNSHPLNQSVRPSSDSHLTYVILL